MANDDDKRERSTIGFPYDDLNASISIADAVNNAIGHGECDTDQIAAQLGTTVTSGTFRVRMAAARVFGLIISEKGKTRLTDVGKRIVDGDREASARIDAFLSVPLYRRVYDEFKGQKLPPPNGLEKQMISFGISSKQGDKARQVLMRSAEQAGFFKHGSDRLVMPAMHAQREEASESPQPHVLKAPTAIESMAQSAAGPMHPFIKGLLDTLPKPNEAWPVAARVMWLRTAANIFGLIYKGGDGWEIGIEAEEEGEPLNP